MRWFRRTANSSGFVGDWEHRIGDLFNSGVDFRGRSVLDAGCNMGLVAYEIAKRGPRFIHGVDRRKDFIHVARMIFLGFSIESQFDRVDITRDRVLRSLLHSEYDVVIFLAVYPHIRRAHGVATAERTLRTLLSRCRQDFIIRLPQADLAEVETIFAAEGFAKTFTGDAMPTGVAHKNKWDSRFHAYHRAAASAAPPASD
jgi:2-polyprenyl-3-methyl-5-hydroxy-6-metoxy-1,4-benzoquinol methylase